MDRPSDYVDWDENETDVAAPSTAEIDDGWILGAQPDRQIFNYLKNLYGRWTRWFDQVVALGTDAWANNQILHAHTILPAEFVGNPPVWTGTHSTTLLAGYFTTAVITGGYRHGPIASPAVVLPDSRDVYVFLGQDGVYDFTAVNNGDPAPATPANHVRVFLFETNAISQIDGGTYFGSGFRFLSNNLPFAFTSGAILGATRGLAHFSSAATNGIAHLIHDGLVRGGNLDIGADSPATLAAKELLSGDGTTIPGGLPAVSTHWWAFTINCRWTGTQWARTDAADAYLFAFYGAGIAILHHPAAQASPWANTLAAGTWTIVGLYGAGFFSVDGGGNVTANNNIDAGGIITAPILTATQEVITDHIEGPASGHATAQLNLINTQVSGPLRLIGVVTDAISSDEDDYNPAGLANANILMIDPGAGAHIITGIEAQQSGHVLVIMNVSATAASRVFLGIENAGSVGANRFKGPTGSSTDPEIRPGRSAIVFYDGNANRWHSLADSASGFA